MKIFTVRGVVHEEAIISHIIIFNGPESRVKCYSLTHCWWGILLDERHKIRVIKVYAFIPKHVTPIRGCWFRRACWTVAQDCEGRGIESGINSGEYCVSKAWIGISGRRRSLRGDTIGIYLSSYPIGAVHCSSKEDVVLRTFSHVLARWSNICVDNTGRDNVSCKHKPNGGHTMLTPNTLKLNIGGQPLCMHM